MPANKPYLLFDAGGTLVFPDHDLVAAIVGKMGCAASAEALFAAHCRLFYQLDSHVRQHGRLPAAWRDYPFELLRTYGLNGQEIESISAAIHTHDRQKSLWTSAPPWAAETLARLAQQGYRMAVISNSDGRVAQILSDLGLAGFFEQIFDSHVLGVEKPDRRIFEVALVALDLQPRAAIYIGDMVHFDVLGANRAGIGAVHLDPLGLYGDWPGVHLPDVRSLPNWLAAYRANPAAFALFPAQGQPDG